MLDRRDIVACKSRGDLHFMKFPPGVGMIDCCIVAAGTVTTVIHVNSGCSPERESLREKVSVS